MRIDVTQYDIDHGSRARSTSCPVALAVKRAVGREDVSMGAWTGHVGETVVKLPLEVTKFVSAFDSNNPVAPFSFDLPWTPQP